MKLTAQGEIANRYWLEIPDHFPQVGLDEFVVMPNHVHGIIIINPVETLHATSLQTRTSQMSAISPKKGSLSVIIRSYKSAVTRHVRREPSLDFAWQPRFYDHIIRDQASLENIRLYISDNPMKWESDEYNPACKNFR